jgi:hypothetical protein
MFFNETTHMGVVNYNVEDGYHGVALIWVTVRLFLKNALNLLHSNSIRQAGDAALDAWIYVVADTATCEGNTNHVW